MKNLSVLILANLTNRKSWLIHALRFLEYGGHRGEVLVGVWNSHDQIPAVEAACAEFKNSMVRVVAQDGAARMTLRLSQLAEQAQGEFIVTQGDDDFLVPAAFRKPIEILVADPGVSCAQGRGVRLQYIDALAGTFNIEGFALWQALGPDPLERFVDLMKHYTFTWYAIYRRDQFRERARYMDDMWAASDDLVFFECIGDLYAVIKGKIVVTDDLYLLRGEHPHAGSREYKVSDRYKMAPYLIFAPTYSASYKHFEALALALLGSMGVDPASPDTLERLERGMLNLMGHRLYKLRAPLNPEERAFQEFLHSPQNTELQKVCNLVFATRPQ